MRWSVVFALGAVVGLAIGLAVGPTGAALIGFKLPYLRLNVPAGGESLASERGLASASSAPSAPRPVAARPADAQPVAKAQPAAVAKAAPLVLPAGRPLTIGVFGDSMADGLWAALYRDLRKKDGSVEVLRFSRNSTGLARYDYVDVQSQTQSQLAEHHVDIAVVMFGTNDGQGLIDSGKVYPFATPAWRAAYAGRIDALVGLLRGQGATVYWVGLPKMEKAYFDQRTSFLNTVFEERTTALGVPFIPTVAETVDDKGQYDAYLAGAGDAHKRLMRAPDGIHMTMAGYLRIAGPVTSRIRQDLASAPLGGAPGAAATPVAARAAAPRLPPMQPLAAQYGMTGPVETAGRP